MPAPIDVTFVDKQTVISVEWLQGVNDVVNAGAVLTTQPAASPQNGSSTWSINGSVQLDGSLFASEGFNLTNLSVDSGGSVLIGAGDFEWKPDFANNLLTFQYKATLVGSYEIVWTYDHDTKNLDFQGTTNLVNVNTLDVDGAATFNGKATFNADAAIVGSGNVDLDIQNTLGTHWRWRSQDAGELNLYEAGVGLVMGLTPAGVLSPSAINFGQSDLDYYEEGTATLSFTSGTYTATFECRYQREGRIVHLFFDAHVTGTTTAGTGALGLSGLPFPISSTGRAFGGMEYTNGVNPGIGGQEYLMPRLSGSILNFYIHKLSGGGAVALDYSYMSAVFRLRGGLSYEV